MDGRVEELQEKLRSHLNEAAENQKLEGLKAEGPHYSQIEDSAHATEKELSRMIQQSGAREVALDSAPQAGCPTCGDVREVCHPRWSINSIDGPVETLKPKAHCPCCRPCSTTAG
ncbi:MAG: hypothetical protein KDA80_06970 [Planctomycetaceae bacterium]|nr:hypothetical protein [Planctomycetaceae bacterium]